MQEARARGLRGICAAGLALGLATGCASKPPAIVLRETVERVHETDTGLEFLKPGRYRYKFTLNEIALDPLCWGQNAGGFEVIARKEPKSPPEVLVGDMATVQFESAEKVSVPILKATLPQGRYFCSRFEVSTTYAGWIEVSSSGDMKFTPCRK